MLVKTIFEKASVCVSSLLDSFFGIFARREDHVARITSMLSMKNIGFGRARWQWKRLLFGDLEISPGSRINPHVAIVGESGSGKSNACKVMVKRLVAKGLNVAILDPHSEYLGIADSINADVYDAAYNGINIFELDGMSEKEKANELTQMFRRVFRLGDVQGYQLYRAIVFTYNRLGAYGKTPNIHDLLYTFEIFKKHSATGEIRILDGLSRRLSLIDAGSFSRSTPMGKVISGNSIFLLSGLHTNEAQSVYIEGFLRKVYGHMLSSEKRSSPMLYIVIDEAEKLGHHSVIGKIAAEGRKYGIGLIVMSQRSKGMDKEIRTNASLFISFYQREPEELNYIANLVSGGNELNRFVEVKRAVRNLRRGSAIVLDSSKRNPCIVRFAANEDEKASLPYEITRMARACATHEEMVSGLAGKGFLPEPASERMQMLVEDGTISSHGLAEGSRYDGKWYIAAPRNSPEHDVCVNVIKRHLDSLHLKCIIYNNSYGPDLTLYKEGRRIAVEYETGSKSRESTEKMLAYRSRLYNEILMIVNDGKIGAYGSLPHARVMRIRDFLAISDAAAL